MKVAVVSRTNALGGGASRIAEELTLGLIRHGVETHHFCAHFTQKPRDFQRPLFPHSTQGRLVAWLQRKVRAAGCGQCFDLESRLLRKHRLGGYDILHFHDHANCISIAAIGELARSKRVFLTCHDFLHATGGCIYPLSCEGYLKNCGACPQKSQLGRFDFSHSNRSSALAVAKKAQVSYLYPSTWLKDAVAKSLPNAEQATVVPNGFDAEPYKFVPRSEARKQLGLANDRQIICISAHYLADPRKGAAYAFAALRSVADLKPLVLLVGKSSDSVEQQLQGIDHWSTGYVHSRERLGLILAASDLFLFTSLQDNLPIVIQETLAAATPVVGFATGGAPEMIQQETSGWLVPTGNQQALNDRLRATMNLPAKTLEHAGREGQDFVAKHFAPEQFIRKHLALYEASP